MKAMLYAIRDNQEWSWRATLDHKVDQTFWIHRADGDLEFLQLQPPLSWGQALWLQNWMNERTRRFKNAKFTEVRGELIKALAFIKASPELLLKLELSSSILSEKDRVGTSVKPTGWIEAVQGKALLPGEWIDLRNEIERRPVPLLITEGYDELQIAYLQGRVRLDQGVQLVRRQRLWRREYELQCSRCGSGPAQMRWTYCNYCEGLCPYCEACLTMGRARFCSPLIHGAADPFSGGIVNKRIRAVKPIEQWGLNTAQLEAAQAGLQFLEKTAATAVSPQASIKAPCFLIWAVTGAGKTEMIFPLIEYELAQGRQVMIATPRKDVVLELLPRIKAAFPQQTIVALYGGSQERWKPGELTLATTHQLLRFYQGFDLVIIDELDAFPYHNNSMLEFAAGQACKLQGRFIFLSATPPIGLEKLARRSKLPHVRVPVRYHQHPLPVPKLLAIPRLKDWVFKKLPSTLQLKLELSLERGATLFLFVSQIRSIEPLVILLRRYFPDKVVQGTHSQDIERSEKVIAFRQTEIDLLVTTTILERGITVPRTDVFVIDTDATLFDEASLVQMAGRAGRSKEDPFGNVYYFAYHRTKAQVNATKHIKRMNAIASKKGYFV